MAESIAATMAFLGAIAFGWSLLRTRRRLRAIREETEAAHQKRLAFIREEHERRKAKPGDPLANLAAFYGQHGPRITEVRACDEMLTHLLSMLGQPVERGPFDLGLPMGALGAIPLIRDDALPSYIVRLVHAGGSARDVVIHLPIPVLPEGDDRG